MSKRATKTKASLLTNADLSKDMFSGFMDDTLRIKTITQQYKNMSIAKAFATFYNVKVADDIKKANEVNTITVIQPGDVYLGYVKEFTKNSMTFTIPSVKEDLVCTENFNSCYEHIQNYLLTHDNKLMFEVREKKNGHTIVSVLNAYYQYWMKMVESAIQKETPITVHIDELVKGGYMAHTSITPLEELTGIEYTNSVFIPGSQIVLNIEKDFQRWVGQDVEIIPQKIVDYKKDFKTGCIEKSIVGSRKRVLQLEGIENLYNLYMAEMLATKNKNSTYTKPSLEGHVTGIINSAKKTGVFIELDDKYITGLLPVEQKDLLDYHPGDPIYVKIAQFEVQENKEPFVTTHSGKVVRSNTRPVFELA